MQPFADSFWRNLHFKGIFLHVNSPRIASCAFSMNHLGENHFLCDSTVHSYFAYFHRGVKLKCKFRCLIWDCLSTWSRVEHEIAFKCLQPAWKCLQMHSVISCIAYAEQKPSRFVRLIAIIAPSPPPTLDGDKHAAAVCADLCNLIANRFLRVSSHSTALVVSRK